MKTIKYDGKQFQILDLISSGERGDDLQRVTVLATRYENLIYQVLNIRVFVFNQTGNTSVDVDHMILTDDMLHDILNVKKPLAATSDHK